MWRMVLSVLMTLAFWGASSERAGAGELPQPTGPVVLTIRGDIANTNGADADGKGAARFDMAALKALGVVTVVTKTPWGDQPVTYEGVPGDAVLRAVGAGGSVLEARAINDYKVEVPVEDLRDRGAFLAFSADGKRLTARDKGPLWLLYPFSDRKELDGAVFYNRSIWQLTSIEVR